MRKSLLKILPGLLLSAPMTASAQPPAPALNHLAGEKSLDLQQHATNPVDWYSWGKAAFA